METLETLKSLKIILQTPYVRFLLNSHYVISTGQLYTFYIHFKIKQLLLYETVKPQTTYIPVGFKLFKLIVNEMMNQMENVENDDDDDISEDEVLQNSIWNY